MPTQRNTTVPRRRLLLAVAALTCALIALLLPALAAANEPIVVNGTGDGATAGACKIGVGECTLRGAIDAANEVPGFNGIFFSLTPVEGTIELTGTPLPELGASTTISGGFCPNVSGGYGPCVTLKAPPGFPALEVAGEVVVESLAIEGGEIGVKVNGASTKIVEDVITGSTVGIELAETGANDLVEETTIADTDRAGIEIEASGTKLFGNTITGTGWAGITVGHRSEHDQIGGDSAGKPNTIDGAETEGAIVIYGEESSRNEVASNFGSGNAGAFIQLRPHGFNKPNGEIKPPTFSTGLLDSASGTAEPGAKVRVFVKALSEEGELGSLLTVVEADPISGLWSASWAPLPAGTLVTATQTTEAGTPEAGTSELAAPRALVANETGGGGGGGGTGTGGSGSGSSPSPRSRSSPGGTPAPPKPTTPAVKITKGPKKSSTTTTAKFKFTATPAAGATFECKLDAAKWTKCKPPKTYKRLKPGKHTFQVRASVPGAPASKPAKFQFTVKP